MSDEEASGIRGRHTVFDLASRRMDTVLSTLDNGMSVLVSPILVKDGHAGFMTFLRDGDKRFFTAYEKKFVGILNSGISSMIEALRLYDSLKELYLNTVKALAAAIDAKDQYTHGHSFRVARYTIAIAKAMNLSEEADMEIAAFMHDLGKIGVPESVLNKKGKLTPAEYEEMKRHPHFTGRILEPIKLPEFIVTTALQHHERLDGSGYPLGLKGDKITLPARIVAVADVFDALTSDRPYRPALTVEKALQHLVDGIDTEFDRDVVSALIRTLKQGTNIRELTDIYRDLKFTDIQHLNFFLVELANMLVK
jgi:HD-GYP domain-containing protein (c-di-GMP phosphodiesterase class II)